MINSLSQPGFQAPTSKLVVMPVTGISPSPLAEASIKKGPKARATYIERMVKFVNDSNILGPSMSIRQLTNQDALELNPTGTGRIHSGDNSSWRSESVTFNFDRNIPVSQIENAFRMGEVKVNPDGTQLYAWV